MEQEHRASSTCIFLTKRDDIRWKFRKSVPMKKRAKTGYVLSFVLLLLLCFSVRPGWSQAEESSALLQTNDDYLVGDSLMKAGRFIEAIQSFEEALADAENSDYLTQSALLQKIAEGYWRSGQLDKAQVAGEEGVKLLQQKAAVVGKKQLLREGYSNLCIIYGLKGEYDKGIAYGLQGIASYQEDSIAAEEIPSSFYNRLGWVYRGSGDLSNAGKSKSF